MTHSPEEMYEIDRHIRMRIPNIPKSYRAALERVQDYCECAIPLTPEEAMAEASRCLHCPDPAACVAGCPVGNHISEAIWYIEHGDFLKAAEVYRKTNPLPEICGRVCPCQATCASNCVLGRHGDAINTRGLEAFVADYERRHGGVPLPQKSPPTGKRVGVIGAGPAGLTVAEYLTIAGHDVTVYEKLPFVGGLLVYGIPNFKLDKEIIREKADWLTSLGVTFKTNYLVEDLDLLIESEKLDVVFLGTGAGVEATMNIPGENLDRVHGSIEFLIRGNVPDEMQPESIKPYKLGKRVAVIGGGDTATDCLRTALRMGAKEVTCYYRRTEAEMPGNEAERKLGIQEGVRIDYLSAPVAMLDTNGDGAVDTMTLIQMELGEPDRSGRRRPVPIEGSEYDVLVDDVVLAIGFWPDPLISEKTRGIETHKWGLFVTDPDTCETSRTGIYAAGDNVTGPALVNAAIASGKKAAAAMHAYLVHGS